MFFTRVGFVIAWLSFISGALTVVILLITLFAGDQAPEAYGFDPKTAGKMLDRGAYTLLFGVGLGILAEISKRIAAPGPNE